LDAIITEVRVHVPGLVFFYSFLYWYLSIDEFAGKCIDGIVVMQLYIYSLDDALYLFGAHESCLGFELIGALSGERV